MNGAKAATRTAATTSPTTRAERQRRGEPDVANSGTSASGANLAAAPSASRSPPAGAERSATSAQTQTIATNASFVLQSSANSVYGYAAHAYASANPSPHP